MQIVKFILINDAGRKDAAHIIGSCHLPDIRQHIVIEAPGFPRSFKVQVSGKTGSDYLQLETRNLEQRDALIQKLVRIRRHHPDAKILGLSELGDYQVHPSEAMNALRRELSDWP